MSIKLAKIRMRINYVSIFLLAILFLGAMLRMYGLDRRSIWYDEANSIIFASRNFEEMSSPYYAYKMLYYLLLKFWVALFGMGESAVRFLSVIFGVLSIFLTYKIGRKLFSQKVGLISCFLLSISCFNIYRSQEAKHFTLFLSLTLLSFLFFIKILSKEKYKYYFLLTLVNVLLLNTHPYALNVFVIQNLLFLFWIKDKRLRERWFICQSIFLFFLFIWFVNPKRPNFLNYVNWIDRPNLSVIIETFQTFSFGGSRLGSNHFIIDSRLLKIPKLLFYIFTFFFIFGLFPIRKKRKVTDPYFFDYNHKMTILISWIFFPIVLSFLISVAFWPIYLVKHFIFVTPAYYIIVSKGIDRMREKLYQVFLFSIISLLTIFSLNPIYYYKNLDMEWKAAGYYVKKNIQEEDAIIIVPLKQLPPFWYYYKYGEKRSLVYIDRFGKRVGEKWQSEFQDDTNVVLGLEEYNDYLSNDGGWLKKIPEFKKNISLKRILESGRNIWIIISWVRDKEVTLLQDYISNLYTKKDERHFVGVDVYYYIPKFRREE